eukprot:TRINITY_DN13873_c0_g1_i1.p1 TRINITY_DN13873_c0_g1~~TRINITY_DN13873_c0_g1_i1.p1  ORF type:complete len:444 (+),score=95.13 TRINITY_DN13873_c0_g1_i1:133-1464(+)
MDTATGAADARNRYTTSFTSRIFEPQSQAQYHLVPAGKRRDQTTSEMFGNYNDKELRAMPKTFQPKDDVTTARSKKLAFLSSEVLPRTAHPQGSAGGYGGGNSNVTPRQECYMAADTEEVIDPRMRRQAEHSSELFGRGTPAVTQEQVHDHSKRLTPTDFKWFNLPEKVPSAGDGQGVSHADRCYNEKRSNLFAYTSPTARDGGSCRFSDDRESRQVEEAEGEQKRRQNVYYSDLFGRNTPMDMPQQDQNGEPVQQYRGKHSSHPEDRITVHQDWTDSKTELVCGARGPKPNTPNTRKANELHQARIFGDDRAYDVKDDMESMNYDNSEKVKGSFGMHTQVIHQAHLRTSMQPNDFYEEAESLKHWEVVELHISGLSLHADEALVRSLCCGFDLQIVKVAVEVDPVRNLCKGRAKIMVRYNPKRDTISNLVRALEEARLRVEI